MKKSRTTLHFSVSHFSVWRLKRWSKMRRSFVPVRFRGTVFILLIIIAVSLIVGGDDDRLLFDDPRLQFLILKNSLQCLFDGHIIQFDGGGWSCFSGHQCCLAFTSFPC